MSGCSLFIRAGVVAMLAPLASAQPPTPTPSPTAPPPLRAAFESLIPEATFEIAGPRDFTATDNAVWISNRSTGSLSRIDPQTNKIVQTIAVGKDLCAGLAADFAAIMAPRCSANQIARIDPAKNVLTDAMNTPLVESTRSLATGVGSVWVITDARGTVARIDPLANTVVAEIYTTPGATSLAFGEGGLWVASASKNLLTRINPYNNLIIERIPVSSGPSDIAIGEGAVWTWNQDDGSVTRIDPKTNAIVTTIRLGAPGGPGGRIAAGEGSVWVATLGTALTRIDVRSNQVAQVFTGAGGGPIVIAHDSIWMAGSSTVVWRLDPRRIEATRAGSPPRP